VKPADDPTSLGSILVDMGLLSRENLATVVELQERSSLDQLLGRLAVAEGLISADQLEEALSAQAGLRSKSRPRRALAQAKIVELSAALVKGAATRLRARATEVRKAHTGQGYPAVSAAMLAKSDD